MPIAGACGMPIAWGAPMPIAGGAPMGCVLSIDDRRSVVAILFMATAGFCLMALLAFGGAPFAFRSNDTSSECRPKSKFFAAFFFSPLDTVEGATESPNKSGDAVFLGAAAFGAGDPKTWSGAAKALDGAGC